jgi:hypothetical protein
MHNDIANTDWTADPDVTPARLTKIDTNAAQSVNGDLGGDWAPSSEIDIGGLGLRARLRFDLIATPTANASFSVATTRLIRLTSAASSNLTLGLTSTGALEGDIIEVACDADFTHEATIQDQSGTPIFVAGNTDRANGSTATFAWLGGAWRRFRQVGGSRFRTLAFTASGTWVAPFDGVVLVRGWGAGGGGGGGQPGTSATGGLARGGGGGAGALERVVVVPVAKGTTYAVTVGAAQGGGQGGTSSIIAAAGTVGEDTTFDTLARFRGGRGGGTCDDFGISGTIYGARGGGPVAVSASNFVLPVDLPTASGGGHALPFGGGTAGGDNASFAGGSGGASGATPSGFQGGGGGGGGGAGPGGAGGNGKPGGAGNSGGVGGGGGSGGSVPGANSGAGGGGGGGGGAGSTSGGFGGAGLPSGAGYLEITWVI